MRFLIGLPSVDNKANIDVIHSFLNQLDYITRSGHFIQCATITNTLIHNARNQIAKISKDYDYLFFLDSDCILPIGTIEKLAGYDKDIVAGMYFQKKFPHWPVIYKINDKGTFDIITDYPQNQLIEVGGVGMGCCLIKTSVFQKLEDEPFEPMAATPTCKAINGEDLAFCKRALQGGFKIYVDTGIQAAHVTERAINEEYYKKSIQALEEREKLKAQPHAEV